MATLTAERWQQVQEVLDTFDALSPAEGADLLETTHRDDPELGRQVKAFLGNEDRIESFLERPLFPICSESLDDGVLVPRIGAYKLIKELGQGGMGTVYLASQEEPFTRQVALKLVRPEILSPEVIGRFEAERQILAGIRHPNVAQLYDGGTTLDGRPYFVMEYVEGEPIEEYCDQHRLPTRERLELFLQVCSAVHLAHRTLRVVHRDLKPHNILMAADERPVIADFGVARQAETTRLTLTGQLAGTPLYMAPEQFAGAEPTESVDLYALGTILFELLSGSVPFAGKDTISTITAIRTTAPPALPSDLAPSLRDTVEALLSKEPEDRPQSAQDVAATLESVVRSSSPR